AASLRRALGAGRTALSRDIKLMLKGSLLWKIKSPRRAKERLYRLQEDGMTIWFERRFRHARSKQIFSVMHIEGVREGYQSEGLRKYGASFPERHCFTIVFKGKRKNLDLAARGEEDARHWVQGLTKLIARVDAMSQREKLDQYPSMGEPGRMCFREIKNVLRMINVDMNDIYAYKLFKECDRSGDERLEEREVEEFCRRLLRRPELEEIFGRYSGEDCVLSAEELREFLRDQAFSNALPLCPPAKQQDLMMLDGFMMYLLSADGDILNQEHTKVHQDMSQPLCHYFISSSHNTYLTDNQIGGTSSTEAYIRAFMKGCRCVELDCWEGSNGEPIIYHGHTLTSKILFRDVIESIRDYAFKQSPYPVILSLENHCGLEQQATMARHMKAILGDMLLTQPLEGQDPKDLPSPEQLKGKVLVKGKKLPDLQHEPRSSGSLSDNEDEEEEEEEEEEEGLQERGSRQVRGGGHEAGSRVLLLSSAKEASQVAPELSSVVVYCQAVPFPGLAQALRDPRPCEMSSFSERKARKLIREAGKAFVRYNAQQLSRVYPLGLKMNSSNYNPQEMWNAGCQLVALNFQTPGYEMDLNAGRFLGNGRCGYVLKPGFLRSSRGSFSPEVPPGPGQAQHRLVLVITAQQLPKLNAEKRSSIVDPLVRVEIHGVPADCSKKQTQHKLNNGGCCSRVASRHPRVLGLHPAPRWVHGPGRRVGRLQDWPLLKPKRWPAQGEGPHRPLRTPQQPKEGPQERHGLPAPCPSALVSLPSLHLLSAPGGCPFAEGFPPARGERRRGGLSQQKLRMGSVSPRDASRLT
uniref:Phosphoinositide phospholipase C n=1 Tax=Apteryx owenii TaxID=8824 RepID=A0A8B9S8G4_APTOW